MNYQTTNGFVLIFKMEIFLHFLVHKFLGIFSNISILFLKTKISERENY